MSILYFLLKPLQGQQLSAKVVNLSLWSRNVGVLWAMISGIMFETCRESQWSHVETLRGIQNILHREPFRISRESLGLSWMTVVSFERVHEAGIPGPSRSLLVMHFLCDACFQLGMYKVSTAVLCQGLPSISKGQPISKGPNTLH